MIFKDFNQTLVPPKGFVVNHVKAKGAYLLVQFVKERDTDTHYIRDYVEIYLNDMGREVARTEDTKTFEKYVANLVPAPVGAWYHFRESFYTALLGLQGMFQCLNKL